MPLYFFHAVNGSDVFTDKDGTDYLDFASAKLYARRLAADLKKNGTFDSFAIVIADNIGRELFRVPVAEQVSLDVVGK
jgi:hypothetical protein